MQALLNAVDSLWALVPSQYADGFHWVQGETPLSSPLFLGSSIVFYLVMVYGIRFGLNFAPKKLQGLQAVHNAFLCLWSTVMFLGTVLEVLRHVNRGSGLYELICDANNELNHGRIYIWVWMFHLSKFYEFIDTLFLAVGKSQIRFLHTYHHVLTLISTYYGLWSGMSVQWEGMMLNTFVHMFMYYYYAIRSTGRTVWWKEYLTQVQIVQFLINLCAAGSWAYWHITRPEGKACAGSWTTFTIVSLANVTFLYLFVSMYIDMYKKPKSSKETDGKPSKETERTPIEKNKLE